MHQFCEAGIAIYNPDVPSRVVNSPRTVYQISPAALELVRTFGSPLWPAALAVFKAKSPSLAEKYASARKQSQVQLRIDREHTVHFSPGPHSELIRQIVEIFGPQFAPGGTLLYAGDTGDRQAYADDQALKELGVDIGSHGKMPDVVMYFQKENWLLLCEAVTSHGPVDGKRHGELKRIFEASSAGLVFVTAFLTRASLARYISKIAWETEVWCAEAPTHLIHFDGERFLGPY